MQSFRGQKAIKFTTKSNKETLASRPSLDIVSLLEKLSKTQAENFCLLKSLFPCYAFCKIPGNPLPRHSEISSLLRALPAVRLLFRVAWPALI